MTDTERTPSERGLEASAKITAEFVAGEVAVNDVAIALADAYGGYPIRYRLTTQTLAPGNLAPTYSATTHSGLAEILKPSAIPNEAWAQDTEEVWVYPLALGRLTVGYIYVERPAGVMWNDDAQQRLRDLIHVGAQSLYAAHKEERIREETPEGYEHFFLD